MREEIQIDLRALFNTLKKYRSIIFILTILITGLGVLLSFKLREEYSSSGKILPEIQGKTSGSLGQFAGLASLAGIDLNTIGGGGIDAVRPDLYPDILKSTPFFLNLLKLEVHTRTNEKLKFEEFYHRTFESENIYKDKYLNKYPVKEDGIIVINYLNETRLKNLRKRVIADMDRKSGILTILVKMPDPVVAAEVSKFAMEYLMEYVKTYRTEKLRQDVDYLEAQVSKSRGKFYSSQVKKAQYSDHFQDMKLQSADVNRERIESEYRLSSTFYNELLKKYEEAKFKLHQETPVFKVLEPPVSPVKRSEPNRAVIVLLSMFIGFCFSILVISLIKGNYKSFIKRV